MSADAELDALLDAALAQVAPSPARLRAAELLSQAVQELEQEDDLGSMRQELQQCITKLQASPAVSGPPSPRASSSAAAAAAPLDVDAIAAGLANEPDMANALESLLQHIVGRDVLYEPLSELAALYGPWLETAGGACSPEERTRFTAQAETVEQMLAIYNGPGQGGTPAEREKLLELITTMQSLGQPPQALVDALGGPVPGMAGGGPAEGGGLPGAGMPPECPTQ